MCTNGRGKLIFADNLWMKDGIDHDSGHYYKEFQDLLKKQKAEFYGFLTHASKWHQPVDSGHIGNQLKRGNLGECKHCPPEFIETFAR